MQGDVTKWHLGKYVTIYCFQFLKEIISIKRNLFEQKCAQAKHFDISQKQARNL